MNLVGSKEGMHYNHIKKKKKKRKKVIGNEIEIFYDLSTFPLN